MLLETLSTARDLGRLHEIASVLIRHGLGDVVRRLGISRPLERAGRVLHWDAIQGLGQKEPPERVREVLEHLGPTFTKFGQVLAGRTDLLSPAWTSELSRLHERAAPVPFDELRAQLTEDLGAPPEEVFRELDPEPLAAASIAQVHRACLQDGTPVVLKIRRPGIRRTVEADLRLLARFAQVAEKEMPEVRRYRPTSVIRQFARSLKNELDLRLESANARRLAQNLREVNGVVVPRFYDEWTCERLCVMDFLDGPSLGHWIHSEEADPADRRLIARLGADVVLRMVFVDGFFHADPHPGNVIKLPGGVGLLDFGMVGRLSEQRRAEFLELLWAVVERREEVVVDILLGWSHDGNLDVDALTEDSVAFVDRYHGASLRDIDVTSLLADIAELLRENNLFLPADVALLLKLFVTLDSLGLLLDPEFVMSAHIEPFVEREVLQSRGVVKAVRRSMVGIGRVLTSLPRDLRRVMLNARLGRVHLEVDVPSLDRLGNQVERSANRLAVGMITAALIIGTSIALTVSTEPVVLGLPRFGLLGFLSSIVVGIWLVWSIFRSGRR